jgi:hypothetical protein
MTAMTTLTHARGARHPAASRPPSDFQVWWTFTPPRAAGAASVHRHGELVIRITRVDAGHAVLEAFVTTEGPRQALFGPECLRCETVHQLAWTHLDLMHQCGSLLKLSWNADGALRYARTPLLARAGLRGGGYDRPRLAPLAAVVLAD